MMRSASQTQLVSSSALCRGPISRRAPPPEIYTKRLRLRPFKDSDHASYATFLADEESTRYLGGTRDAETAWRVMASFCGHWNLRGYGPFAIETRESARFVGYCGPWFPFGKPEQEILWGVMPAARRNGFAAEAARAARQWAYDIGGWTGAVSYIVPGNAASEGVARKLGASPEDQIDMGGVEVNVWRHPGPEALQ